MAENESFNYSAIPEGYYHQVMETGSPIRRSWHRQKFERVKECLPTSGGLSILDIGCFAGTFLSLLPEKQFSVQLGIDILENQVKFAQENFATPFRGYKHIKDVGEIDQIERQFDVVTLIEVIEHLKAEEIKVLIGQVERRLKPGGTFVVTTPNYLSSWPALELVLNRVSEVSYEEQHITKFTYPGFEKKLAQIYPDLEKQFRLSMKTTTHFISPFLAPFSMAFSEKLSKAVPHQKWCFPFGNLIVSTFVKKA